MMSAQIMSSSSVFIRSDSQSFFTKKQRKTLQRCLNSQQFSKTLFNVSSKLLDNYSRCCENETLVERDMLLNIKEHIVNTTLIHIDNLEKEIRKYNRKIKFEKDYSELQEHRFGDEYNDEKHLQNLQEFDNKIQNATYNLKKANKVLKFVNKLNF